VITKLGRCLHWERTSHVFVTEQHDVPPLVGPSLNVERVVLEGVLRHHALERALTLLDAGVDAAPKLRTSPAHIAARFELDRPAVERLESALGSATLGAAVRGGERELVFLLAALALCDQLALPEPEAPDKSGPFVIDDLPRAARARTSVRSVEGEPAQGGLPPGASSELPGREKLLADTAYLQGKQLLRVGEYGAAADAFREASNLRPAALEYTLCAAWSAYLSAGRVGKWRDMLGELCERTLEQDGQLAFAHHVRGQLAYEAKDYRTATEALTRALELDPDDEEARRTLARIAN
jgi:tetratricopeptide (TPR) repeat protein